ncbi:MAG TPA: hypothetical protein PKI36_14750, partial [Turneriella sp.]|nr:hypothetical protein [Turneriella sp.]
MLMPANPLMSHQNAPSAVLLIRGQGACLTRWNLLALILVGLNLAIASLYKFTGLAISMLIFPLCLAHLTHEIQRLFAVCVTSATIGQHQRPPSLELREFERLTLDRRQRLLGQGLRRQKLSVIHRTVGTPEKVQHIGRNEREHAYEPQQNHCFFAVQDF